MKTETGNIHTLAHTLEAGASGAMMKTADDAMIVSAIRKVAAVETYISPDVSR
ncbi:MAG: response regulator transcription factor [Kiritimatiellae bacterium]|nr:response regulator transcription factor [Kiritimatiellia bacterium]